MVCQYVYGGIQLVTNDLLDSLENVTLVFIVNKYFD